MIKPPPAKSPLLARFQSPAHLDRALAMTYKPNGLARVPRRLAQVAQLVEQRTENPRVGGSIPPLGTILPKK